MAATLVVKLETTDMVAERHLVAVGVKRSKIEFIN